MKQLTTDEPVALAGGATVATTAVAALAAVGVHATPEQVTTVIAAVGIVAHVAATLWARSKAWPDKKIQTFLAHARSVEPGPAAVAPLEQPPTAP